MDKRCIYGKLNKEVEIKETGSTYDGQATDTIDVIVNNTTNKISANLITHEQERINNNPSLTISNDREIIKKDQVIIDADLLAENFVPVANTYYRHVGEDESIESFIPLEIGDDVSGGEKIYVRKINNIDSIIDNLIGESTSDFFILADGTGTFPLFIARYQGGVHDISYVWSYQAGDSTVIYSHRDGEEIEWNEDILDDGSLILGGSLSCTIEHLYGYGWNGIILGKKPTQKPIKHNLIYFYDGEKYNPIDGSGGSTGKEYSGQSTQSIELTVDNINDTISATINANFIDNTPTNGSTNLITSGAVYNAIVGALNTPV